MIESLEPRRLMSASLVNGALTVEGTDLTDQISLSVSGKKANQTLNVKILTAGVATVQSFKLSEVNTIAIFGYGAADLISVSSSVKIGCVIDGGEGKDLISGGGGNDTIFASGDGAGDLIAGGGGKDTAYVDRFDSANVEKKIFA